MSTILVVANPEDRLVQWVCSRARRVIRCTENELFSTCAFALLQDGVQVDGMLTLSGRRLSLARLSGVLFRPTRQWRPPAGLSARHRAFVRHETQAAWCAVLDALPCPVLNRMGPGWWLDAAWDRAQLVRTFARRLDLPLSVGSDEWDSPRSRRTEGCGVAAQVYVVGTHAVAGNARSLDMRKHLEVRAKDLAQWQRDTGIGFARIDFGGGSAVERVDPLPAMGRAPDALLDTLGARIVESLQ